MKMYKTVIVFVLTLLILVSVNIVSYAHNPITEEELYHSFHHHDGVNWQVSDGWRNDDSFFGCHWSQNRVNFFDGEMELSLRTNHSYAAPYNYECAEYATTHFYGYGLYEVSMKPSNVSGVISSFFTYTGPSYNGAPWDEIDIEFLGNDTTKVQFNYYTNGVGGNEILHDLGFDAANSFNTYAFDWQENYISWYVNGQLVATATENIPSNPSKIMMNIWNTYGIDEWAGAYGGQNANASYEWMRYTPNNGGPQTPIASDFQLRACEYSDASGVTSWNCGVGSFYPGNWIKFDNVNLSTGYNAFAVSYASTQSGSFDIRLGSPNGRIIGTVNYGPTAGWANYQWNGTPSLDVTAQGVHDIYIVSRAGSANLREFWFKNE
ncbi:endo-beta-1,3-1,4 glucanase [Halalkalibacter hemicellulosilyticusJCM 9152]|uniref:Beta-glucanase n=2 Tax=Halalkalibacter TaxID=2893056 RepID=W4QLD5_9BACI|nr:family 16 glycosylhydrolase [Halalkalibacter hemicellulosilyticus]GAE32727.1 endo-beta-1,3-1,4 glucanase [Halalkalibacter hemicellulosilyticusJCM 9152]